MSDTLAGTIIRGYSGFYYVLAGGCLYECSLRGRHRLAEKEGFLAGDRVVIRPLDGTRGVVEELAPRRNRLVRPPVANVDQVVVVTSLDRPGPDLVLLDRILIMVAREGLRPLVILNKADLVEPVVAARLAELYLSPGYWVAATSAHTRQGVEQLAAELAGRVTVFAGASGVGKSSLLNAVQPGLALRTGEVSGKTSRGRHTTRHVELLFLEGGGLVADTPGFSHLELPGMRAEELAGLFPEMADLRYRCRFRSCIHHREPGCEIQAAVARGAIDPGRYSHYLMFLEEVREKERIY